MKKKLKSNEEEESKSSKEKEAKKKNSFEESPTTTTIELIENLEKELNEIKTPQVENASTSDSLEIRMKAALDIADKIKSDIENKEVERIEARLALGLIYIGEVVRAMNEQRGRTSNKNTITSETENEDSKETTTSKTKEEYFTSKDVDPEKLKKENPKIPNDEKEKESQLYTLREFLRTKRNDICHSAQKNDDSFHREYNNVIECVNFLLKHKKRHIVHKYVSKSKMNLLWRYTSSAFLKHISKPIKP